MFWLIHPAREVVPEVRVTFSELPEPSVVSLPRLSGLEVPIPTLVPSNVSALPLVATLLPFRYSTPLAVPPERVRLDESVAVPALTEAMDAPVTVSPVITAVPTLADATLAPVAVRFVTVAVVSNATPAFMLAMEAPVAVRLVITATPALMEAIEAAVN